MPTNTYVPLATLTLTATDTSITFSSLPTSGYRDLIFVLVGKSTPNDTAPRIRFNGDSGSNYTYVYMQGSSGGAASSSGTNTYIDSYILSSNTCTTIHHIMDYSATDKSKTVLSYRDLAGVDTMRQAQRWANTSAITSLEVFVPSNSLAIGTQISLYGIA